VPACRCRSRARVYANALPGIAAAWFEAYPLVHLDGRLSRPARRPSQAHKRMDQAALVAPVTKASRFSAKDGPSFTAMAHFACAEEPGPVLFELAPSAPARARGIAGNRHPPRGRYTGAGTLRKAQRPIVIAGALALRAGLGATVAKLNCPVFSTGRGEGDRR
jgi:thiamine pyrophosphate-dependent acetolactate synthase large subunit-like protein